MSELSHSLQSAHGGFSVMPTCKCNAHDCINYDGVILDDDTARQHAIDDNYQYTSRMSDAAPEVTMDDITAYLKSTTLSCVPFQANQPPGGGLWVRSRPKSKDQRGALGVEDSPPLQEMRDILEGQLFCQFKGPGSLHSFIGEGERRYVFSLGFDSFNTRVNNLMEKKSMGIISLLCLNLPPLIQYKPENILLAGIVPGRKEPPLEGLNHYLKPLIDELCEFWEGAHFTRTDKGLNGRRVQCALVAVVCDIPAVRKTAGLATANFGLGQRKSPRAGNDNGLTGFFHSVGPGEPPDDPQTRRLKSHS